MNTLALQVANRIFGFKIEVIHFQAGICCESGIYVLHGMELGLARPGLVKHTTTIKMSTIFVFLVILEEIDLLT